MKNSRFMSWSKAKKLNIKRRENMYSGPIVLGISPVSVYLVIIIIAVALAVCLRKPLRTFLDWLWNLIQSVWQ